VHRVWVTGVSNRNLGTMHFFLGDSNSPPRLGRGVGSFSSPAVASIVPSEVSPVSSTLSRHESGTYAHRSSGRAYFTILSFLSTPHSGVRNRNIESKHCLVQLFGTLLD